MPSLARFVASVYRARLCGWRRRHPHRPRGVRSWRPAGVSGAKARPKGMAGASDARGERATEAPAGRNRTCELRGRGCWSGSLPGSGIRPTLRFWRSTSGRAAWRRRAAIGGRRRDRKLAEMAVDELVELVGAEGLLLDEPGDHRVEEAPVLREELVRAPASAVDDLVDLAVDQLGRLLGVVLLLLDLA